MTAQHTRRPLATRSLQAGRSTGRRFGLRTWMPGALAALALIAAAPAHAMGDATDAELPWVRPAVDQPLHGSTQPSAASTAQDKQAQAQQQPSGDAMDNEWLPITASRVLGTGDEQEGLSRAEVRESLAVWRAAGLMSPQGEIGDTSETLRRREEFYALQTEVIEAEQRAAAAEAQQAWATAQLQQQGVPAEMVQPSADGALLVGEDGTVVEVVEIDE